MTPSLLALKGISPETVNPETINQLIDRAKHDEGFENKLIEALKREKQKDPRDPIVYWIMLVLGHAQSQRAIPPLMECLWDDREYLIGEIAQHALPQIGEPAFRAALEAFDGDELNSDQRIGLYFLLQNVPEVDNADLRLETATVLKDRVREERTDGSKHLVELALKTLAAFGDEGDPEFVRRTLEEIPSSPETQEAKNLLDGTTNYSDRQAINKSWQDIAHKIPN